MRRSGSAVFLALGIMASRVLVAQSVADTVSIPPLKSGSVATGLAVLVPGAGHVYAGEKKRGLILTAATALTFMYGFSDSRCQGPYTSVRTCDVNDTRALATASMITGLGLYAFNLWDAHRAARRSNARRASQSSGALDGSRDRRASGRR